MVTLAIVKTRSTVVPTMEASEGKNPDLPKVRESGFSDSEI